MLISFITLCSFAFLQTQGGLIDDAVYATIKVVLTNSYPGEPKRVDCIMEELKEKKVADKFFTTDILINQDRVKSTIKKEVDIADISKYKVFCVTFWFNKFSFQNAR